MNWRAQYTKDREHPDCPYGPTCDPSSEPCCDGCASGLGPCHGPGYTIVCLTHEGAR